MLLVARRKDGTLFSLVDVREKEELLAMRKREAFFCPGCGETVRLRLGDRRSWHFAHRSKASCSSATEAESAYHLEGKRMLYEWLEKQGAAVKLEPYLPSLKQRPDLLLHTHPRTTALEFQCSSISPELFTKRSKSLRQARFVPIWLLGGNRLRRTGANTFHLSQMDWLALRKMPRNDVSPHLIYFCPEAKQFAVLTDLIACGTSKVLARVTFSPISSFSIHDLYRSQLTGKFHIPMAWLNEKKQWRLHVFRSRSRSHRYVQKLYGHLSYIPPAAGWPTPHAFIIETPCFLWQGWLFYQFYLHWPYGKPITLQNIQHAFSTLIRRGVFSVRRFPLWESRDEGRPLLEYLQCLVAFGMLRQIGETTFQKTTKAPVQSSDDMARTEKAYFEMLSGIF